jgi:hypothetical protein
VTPDNEGDFELDLKESMDWLLRIKGILDLVVEIVDSLI